MRYLLTTAALIMSVPLHAQVKTPDRPATNPKSLVSPANPAAKPIPIEALATTPSISGATWTADGRAVVIAANISGRANLWRIDSPGAAPVRLTQSDEAQSLPVAAGDGNWIYFQQDVGGNEYPDVYRVPVAGGAVEQITRTPDIREGNLLASRSGPIALVHKAKSEGQSNVAVLAPDGTVRVLTKETDPQFGWSPVAWVDGDRALIANRRRTDSRVIEVWRIAVADGAATKLLGKADTIYEAGGATADGKRLSVTTTEGTGQRHAGLYDVASGRWSWLKPTPWEQNANAISPDGRRMIVRTSLDARAGLATVDTATLAETPIALDPGVNAATGQQPFSSDGTRLIATHSGADSVTELMQVDLPANRVTALTRFAGPALASAGLPKSQVVTYRSFDGTPVSAIVTMPFNLKRDSRAPGIVLPHGGPTSQALDGFNRTATALASRGYVVIQPNFRGSTGYGAAFQAANHKDLGGGDLKDTVAAKDFMVATGYVDPRRVGITGGSYGGFMTLMALGRTPDAFAAGVQMFGIINWRTMYRDQDEQLKAYQRSLIGTPDADAAVYDAASPLTYIRQAKAPLLTLQGENDIRVPRGQAQEVADILKAKGNIVETVYYPAEGHGFQRRENQIDSLKRTVEWFDRYLKPAQ
ncbi:prolyl oligopeptidase family serine peptidase [Sphingomonas floccifaciens]|uniref:Acyl-peptide hydrolase n=1 Tax=Sphingomonas floccifaciens TaxID=1844115 RepID=A0ABW4NAS0_9SPHN